MQIARRPLGLIAVGLTAGYVLGGWVMPLHRYDRFDGRPVRVNRLTGRTERLFPTGWRVIDKGWLATSTPTPSIATPTPTPTPEPEHWPIPNFKTRSGLPGRRTMSLRFLGPEFFKDHPGFKEWAETAEGQREIAEAMRHTRKAEAKSEPLDFRDPSLNQRLLLELYGEDAYRDRPGFKEWSQTDEGRRVLAEVREAREN